MGKGPLDSRREARDCVDQPLHFFRFLFSFALLLLWGTGCTADRPNFPVRSEMTSRNEESIPLYLQETPPDFLILPAMGSTSHNQIAYNQALASREFRLNRQNEIEIQERGVGALLGLAVGDAVGISKNFQPRSMNPSELILDMVGGPSWLFEESGGVVAGEFGSATSLALALGESILAEGRLSSDDVLMRFLMWLEDGYLSSHYLSGRFSNQPAFDVDEITRASLEYARIYPRESSPGMMRYFEAPYGASSGSITSLSPIAIYYTLSVQNNDLQQLRSNVAASGRIISRLLHANPLSSDTAGVFAYLISYALHHPDLINDEDLKEAVLSARGFDFSRVSPEIRELFEGEEGSPPAWRVKSRSELISDVNSPVYILECALWAILKTNSYQDAILMAANLGGFSSATTSVTGQLAGALYGATAIPAGWSNRLVASDRIQILGSLLSNYSFAYQSARSRNLFPSVFPEPEQSYSSN